MNIPTETDVVKIYEKSVRLLNDKQVRLMKMRQVLKKAVIRLSLASRSDNEQVNNVLHEIKLSVNNHVDLDMLSKHLDDLFVLMNHADSSKKTAFYSHLEKKLEVYESSALSSETISKLKVLIDKNLNDDDMSAALLNLIDDISGDKKQYIDNISLFIKDISDSTDFEYQKKDVESSEIMQDLALELTKYIYSINRDNDFNDEQLKNQDNKVYTSQVLREIVNQLTLPSASISDQLDIAKILNDSDNDNYKEVTQKLIQLVNQSIGSVEQEKQDLKIYITNISMQLADIESFMHVMRSDSDDANSRSLALTESVETGVLDIEKTVSKSADLTELKQTVAENLKEIRKHVEDFKHADEDKKEISGKNYEKIIDELSRAQKESIKLKDQLHESKAQLLSDPLTGIPNRLAYEERIVVEFNRWKRNKTPLCLAIWDLDHFKSINDNYGHGVGDRVLKLFADIIQSRIRNVDMFARIGGEEFVLLMPDTPLDMALALNNTLRTMLEECNFHYDNQHCHITSSVGIAEFLEGDEASDVLEKADNALYQSKNTGRNRCTVFKEDN